jgi:hypothetical protein
MAGMTEPNDGSGSRPAWTAWWRSGSSGEGLQEVGAGDDPGGAAGVHDEQRLALAGEQLDGVAHGRRRGTAPNGGSMTSMIGAPSRAASVTACLSSPRSPIEPTTERPSWADTTGSWETRCSCRSATASRTRSSVLTVTSGGTSPSACLRRSTSPTVSAPTRARKPCCVIHWSLKIFDR